MDYGFLTYTVQEFQSEPLRNTHAAFSRAPADRPEPESEGTAPPGKE